MTIEKLEIEITNCRKCDLYQTRTRCVIGGGNLDSDIMMIGEAPGEQEDRRGEVFVGPSGVLLDKMLAAIQLDRTKVYITNILKCRPPRNRTPHSKEITACMDYLREQFKLMRPKVIILLGSVACKAILSPDFSVMRHHGEITERKGVYFLPTFHPSALLRDESKKPLAYKDLLNLKALLEQKIPTTDR
ncbi:MAG: uracil-DNA glycosylase [Clostridia bacterium]|nr:uracil-DNA glycosylase [Clostridia bacterium]